jgi:hypothetical protein
VVETKSVTHSLGDTDSIALKWSKNVFLGCFNFVWREGAISITGHRQFFLFFICVCVCVCVCVLLGVKPRASCMQGKHQWATSPTTRGNSDELHRFGKPPIQSSLLPDHFIDKITKEGPGHLPCTLPPSPLGLPHLGNANL